MNTPSTTAPTFTLTFAGISLTASGKYKEYHSAYFGGPRLMDESEYTITVKTDDGESVKFSFFDRRPGCTVTEKLLLEALRSFTNDATLFVTNDSAEAMAHEIGLELKSRKQQRRAGKLYRGCEAASAKLERLGFDHDQQLNLYNHLRELQPAA